MSAILRDYNENKIFKMPAPTGTTISAGEIIKNNSGDAQAVSGSGDTAAGVVIDGVDEDINNNSNKEVTVALEAVIEADAEAVFAFGENGVYNGTGMTKDGSLTSSATTRQYVKAVKAVSSGNTGKFLVDTSL